LRVIFLNRFFYPDCSATSQILSDLAFNLSASKIDVCVIASRQRYDDPRAGLKAFETVLGVRIYRAWTTHYGRGSLVGRFFDYLSFYLTSFWRLLILTSGKDTVVAMTDPPLTSVIAALAAKIRGARLINWTQDLFPEVALVLRVKGVHGCAAHLLKNIRNTSLQAADVNVVIGKKMGQRINDQGVETKRIKVIHNWSDGGMIKPLSHAENPLRKEWGLERKFVVGYSGNMGRAHEFETILGAAELLKDKKEIIFLFIGEGSQRALIEAQVKIRGLQNFLFKPTQAYEYLSHSLCVADIHLVTLRPELEGLIVPSKFYGIVAAGRPVIFIGDKEGEIGGLILEGKCGYSVASGETTDLKQRILALAGDTELVHRMGTIGRVFFERAFDKSIALKVWREALLI